MMPPPPRVPGKWPWFVADRPWARGGYADGPPAAAAAAAAAHLCAAAALGRAKKGSRAQGIRSIPPREGGAGVGKGMLVTGQSKEARRDTRADSPPGP